MRIKIKIQPLLLLMAIFTSPIQSQEVVEMRDEMAIYTPARFLEIHEDPAGEEGIEDVARLGEESWGRYLKHDTPNFGFTRSAYWLRFTLTHFYGREERIFFEIDSPLIDSLRIYSADPSGGWKEQKKGLTEVDNGTAIPHHDPLFAVTVSAGEPLTLYMRFQSESSIQAPVYIMSDRSFTNKINREQLYYGIFFGVLFLLIFYNAFLYYTLKIDNGSHYLLLIGSFTLFHLCDLGFMTDFFWSDLPWLSRHCLAISGTFVIFTTLQFAQRYLRLSEHYRRLDIAVRIMILTLIPLGILSLTDNISIAQQIAVLMGLTYGPILLSIIIYITMKGYRSARFTLFGILCLLIGILPYLLMMLGYPSYMILTRFIMMAGTGLMAVLLSLGIEERIRLIRDDQRRELENDIWSRTRELTESEQRTRILTERANDGIVIIRDNRITFANQKISDILGYPTGDIIGTTWRNYVFPSDHSFIQNQYDKRMSGEDVKNEYELSLKRRDGSSVTALISGSLINHEGGVADLVMVRDVEHIHRHRMLREDIEKLVRHDLKNPLNGIIGFSELIASDRDLKKETKEILRMIHANGIQMLYMIDHTLDYFKMAEGSYFPKPEAVDLLGVIGKTEKEMRFLTSKKGVRINILLEKEPPGVKDTFYLYGERFHLEVLISNLLKNAVEAAPDESTVTVKLLKRDKTKVIDIHNFGAIPERIRDKFFERMTTANKVGGSGYGTYSASLIAKSHGGDIAFTTSEEEGTHLIVTLP